MIRAVIVENDADERLRIRECLSWLEQTENTSFQITEFPSGTAFIGAYEPEYDIVFMDIEMPGMNGLEAARELRKIDPAVILIFVTNMAQYAIAGYEVEALDFILKPINKYSFAIKVKRAVSRVPKKTEDYIFVKTDGEKRQIPISSVRYLDMDGHYVIYHTKEGDLKEYATLKEACGKLQRSFFVFANRSCLVNLFYVTSVSRDSVMLGNDRIDISRPQKKVFLNAVSEFMGGGR